MNVYMFSILDLKLKPKRMNQELTVYKYGCSHILNFYSKNEDQKKSNKNSQYSSMNTYMFSILDLKMTSQQVKQEPAVYRYGC